MPIILETSATDRLLLEDGSVLLLENDALGSAVSVLHRRMMAGMFQGIFRGVN